MGELRVDPVLPLDPYFSSNSANSFLFVKKKKQNNYQVSSFIGYENVSTWRCDPHFGFQGKGLHSNIGEINLPLLFH